MIALVGCLALVLVMAAYLAALAYTETDTAPYDPEDGER